MVGEAMNNCEPWHLALHHSGYGVKTHEGKQWQAHRYVWAIVHGKELPTGGVIGHACNNKCCTNIDHLYLTDAATNSTHAARDGLYKVGEKHGRSKMTADVVKQIRAVTNPNFNALAREHGVDSKTVWNAWHRVTWRSAL